VLHAAVADADLRTPSSQVRPLSVSGLGLCAGSNVGSEGGGSEPSSMPGVRMTRLPPDYLKFSRGDGTLAEHQRLARATVTIDTSISAPELLTLAGRVAQETRGVTWDLDKNVRLTIVGQEAHRLRIAIGNRKTTMHFWISVGSSASGRSTLHTEIDQAVTSQWTLGGIIPAGPKTLPGYGFYKQFMLNIEAVVKARDPHCRTRISE